MRDRFALIRDLTAVRYESTGAARRFFPEAARKFESDNDFELLWKARTALSAVLSFRGSVCLLLQLLRRLAVISRCEFTAEGSRAARDERLNKQTDAKGIRFARE